MRALALVSLLIVGCDALAPSVDAGPLFEHYVLSRVHVDPLTEVGARVDEDSTLTQSLGLAFERASCDGPSPILVALEGQHAERRVVGTLTLLVAQAEEGDPCGGAGVFDVDEVASFGPDGAPYAQGPLYVEGRTAEARVPISRVNPVLLGFLPPWWSVTARRAQGTELFGDTTAESIWRVRQLAGTASRTTPGRTLLDELVALGAQPDRDVDRDGLERLLDVDGDGLVDRCVDGDGTPWDGRECMLDGRFADGFELRLRFRLVAASVVDR